jgi:uncharacterized HAD superfamily protein
MPLSIGLDLDGVLVNWHRAVYTYTVAFNNEKRTYEQFWREYRTMPKSFWEITEWPDLYEKCMPTQDVLDTLKYLDSEGHTLYYITHRTETCRRVTEKYVNKWFPQSMNLVLTKDKGKYVRLYKIDIFVEDRECNANELKNLCKVLFMKQPWNEGYRDGLTCISKLSDIKKYLSQEKLIREYEWA